MQGKRLRGMISAPITPTDKDGRLDSGMISRLVNIGLEKGVEGFFAIGSTGNFTTFTVEERKRVAEDFTKAVDGRVPLCIHIGAANEQESLELAQHAGSIGVDALAAVPPYYFKYDEKALLEYFVRLAAVNPDVPFYLYNIPQFAQNDISTALLQKLLAAMPNLAGAKDTTQDFTRFLDGLNAFSGKADMIMGSDAMCVAALDAGGAGGICAMSTHNPELMVDIFTAWRAGDRQKAQHLQFLAAHLRQMLMRLPNFTPRVEIMRLRGILDAYPRRPIRMLTKDEHSFMLNTLHSLEEQFAYPLLAKV